jgi:hypothetical protein
MGEGRRRIVVDPLYRILFSSTNESTLDTYNHIQESQNNCTE